jgi:CRP-like cAMP-binding protein
MPFAPLEDLLVERLIRKLEVRDRLSGEEKRVLQDMVSSVRDVAPNDDIVREGDRPAHSLLLLEGFTCRAVVLSGGQRQITSIHIPGDFVDLHGFLLKVMDHSVTSLSACRIALVPHTTLREISEKHPHLTRLLWLATLIDAAIHRRWITSLGRQSALAHTAHLLCEMYLRQKEAELTNGAAFRMPMTQVRLADALGLSTVHTNRVVKEIRATGFVEWEGEAATMKDFDGLARMADFDPTYLNLQQEPR